MVKFTVLDTNKTGSKTAWKHARACKHVNFSNYVVSGNEDGQVYCSFMKLFLF